LIRPNGISMHVLRTGSVEVIEDVNNQRERVNPSMFRDGISAALCLPLSLHGERIGVMWIHYDEPRHFHEFEVDALKLYANQAAITYDSTRRIAEMEHMRKAAEFLAGAESLEEVLETIVHSAQDVLRADSIIIWPYDNIRDEFIMERSVAASIPTDIWEKFQQTELRRGQTAYTVMEQTWMGVMDISNVDQYPFLDESTRMFLQNNGVQSFQGIALTVGDEKLGILYVNHNYH